MKITKQNNPFTPLVQQHHDAVSVGVAVEMPGNHVSVLPEDADQPLVVAFLNSSGVFDERQIAHRNVTYDVNLQTKKQREIFVSKGYITKYLKQNF